MSEKMQHVGYFDEGSFHWMSGIAPRDCELYTRRADVVEVPPENPPAFPEVPGDFNAYEGRSGMTLRDWFAGQALAECIRNAICIDNAWDEHNVAYHAYLVADAMLAARGEA